MNTDSPLTAIRRKAMDLMARREHSRKELHDKLHQRQLHSELIEEVLDQLEQEGLLCDARFAESFIRTRTARGQGPLRIQQELQQRGVDAEPQWFADTDWLMQARQVREQRFGVELPVDRQEQARQMRFLQYRGFSSEQIRAVMND